MATVEERLNALEKKVDWYRRATAVLALVLVAGVTMGQSTKDAEYGKVVCETLMVMQGDEVVVALGAGDLGNGFIGTYSSKGTQLVEIASTVGGTGVFSTFSEQGKRLVRLSATKGGDGAIRVQSANGTPGVSMAGRGPGDNGGIVGVYNKTGESIVGLLADEYGNGVVGAWNRKGKGRTLTPGP